MKQIKSITLLFMVLLTVALTGPTTARAAVITPEGRNEIVAVYVTMVGRAPSQAKLDELVAMVQSGKKLVDVAQEITTAADFAARYPGFMTSDEFADKLTQDLFGNKVSATTQAWAREWVKGRLGNGASVANVFVEAVQAIRATTNTDLLAAKDAHADKVSEALNAPTPEAKSNATPGTYYIAKASTSATVAGQTVITGVSGSTTTNAPPVAVIDSSKIGEILKDLREIAEDLKIEEEDGSAYFKGGVQQATDKVAELERKIAELERKLASAPENERAALQSQLTQARTDLTQARTDLATSPSEAYKNVLALEAELKSATTDAQRQAVVDKLGEIQRTLTPWLGFAGNNPGNSPNARTLTDEGLKNLRAINDRVVRGLTGGQNCSSEYNSNTHAYQTVCR